MATKAFPRTLEDDHMEDRIVQHIPENQLPVLDTGDRGGATLARNLSIVHTEGETYLRKWPRYGVSEVGAQSVEYFLNHVGGYPTLRAHFPTTAMKDNYKGRYFLQALVETKPGKANMSYAEPERAGLFDPEQIDDPALLTDLMGIVRDFNAFYKDSLTDPNNGLDEGEGWYPEFTLADNFVVGRRPGDRRDKVYFVDFFPTIPVREDVFQSRLDIFTRVMDGISRSNFGMSIEEFVATYGEDDATERVSGAQLLDLEKARATKRQKVAQGLVPVTHIV